MMTESQITRLIAYDRNEYINRLVSQLLRALRYRFEARLAKHPTKRAGLMRASKNVIHVSLACEMLHETRFRNRHSAFVEALAEARQCEPKIKSLVENVARRSGSLANVDTTAFWRSVNVASKKTWSLPLSSA